MSGIFSSIESASEKKPGEILLLPGRWHAITKAQESAIKNAVEACALPSHRLVFVMTACDKGGSKRHPLYASERRQLLSRFAESFKREFEIYEIRDVNDKENWADYVARELANLSGGKTIPSALSSKIVSGNPDIIARFQTRSYAVQEIESSGEMPADFLAVVANNGNWRQLGCPATCMIYEQEAVHNRIVRIFRDVLLNEEGELSTGRDFATYAAGMDASTQIKLRDICPWVKGGKVVDKGCGTGSLLVHLSELFPESEIVGMDLSKELLRLSESKHYPNHNVAVVKGNIIQQRFQTGSLGTIIYSSVMHEVYSYNGYDRDQVRKALLNSHKELMPGGRLIIRDGIKPAHPDKTVWMRLDEEAEVRFRKFACEFKSKSKAPGVEFAEKKIGEQTWFHLSLHSAGEFLSKKDYLANWAIEVNEEFGVFTLAEWRQELASAGYEVLECSSYLNDWIEKNRYLEHAWLYEDEDGAPGQPLAYPDTTAVIVAEKV